MVLKIYAVRTWQPFTFYIYGMKGIESEYYLTDYGLSWVYSFFQDKTLDYARSLFGQLFVRATQDTLKHLDTYPYFNNFRGTIGVKKPLGSKQKALIIRKVGRTERKYEFDSIRDARTQLNVWLTMYSPEEFTIYRIREQPGKGTFKEKLKLVVEKKPSKNIGKVDWTKI